MDAFEGGLEVQTLSGSVVQRPDVGLQLLGCDLRQIGAFGQVLTQQAVGVLIGPAFPRVIGVGEVDRQAQPAFQFAGTSKLAAVVQGEAVAFLSRQPGNRLPELLGYRLVPAGSRTDNASLHQGTRVREWVEQNEPVGGEKCRKSLWTKE